ncbi:MAG: bifunctional diaminohydroxyphosphoribosylaminopyrimidine deaminase/5-amino-6-(5-phosphoribosylamino)uracil reductase RibD [Pseudoxanthomonas suwonensis]|nr:bifunctional diaminohydroxyphosphoribosylaminopyrimidine deaminase/5-amino-6-(5-phosphoribosylamino)uracil reductase RibD [Pseudoxanthomonas suwonensis]
MTETLEFDAFDHASMARALRLAARGSYTTKPNPMVGCVLARDGQVVGEGWHVRAGEAHAEIAALQAAGDAARGATAYVTLEPCAHTGRTGPCTDALIDAGIAKVVAAMRDPFPKVDGAGFQRLREAGIEVRSGLMESQARRLNRSFFSRVERGRPWLRVKLGISLDGRTALANGESQWITSPEAREDVHHWRARCGALLTGAGTVLADDPHLTVRLDSGDDFVPPLRVVLDPGLATVARGNVRAGEVPTLYYHAPDIKPPRDTALQRQPITAVGVGLDLTAVLEDLARREINEVQVETGATLAGAFLKAGLIDELLVYIAPVLLGDGARPMFDGLGIRTMAERHQLQLLETRHVGPDIRLLLQSRQAS